MTAFYMFRTIFMTFFGEWRGGDPSGLHHGDGHDDHGHHEIPYDHLHESPFVMVGPMVFLCVLAIGSGLAIGGASAVEFMGGHAHGFFALFSDFGTDSAVHSLPLIGLIVALAGIFVAYAIYSAKWISNEAIGAVFKPIRTLWYRKYYMDELYEDIIIRGILMRGIFWICAAFDTYVVDGVVNGTATFARGVGNGLRKFQTGQLQEYGVAMGFGVVVMLVVFMVGFYG
jgi:NADH-quinone oxidoreductase subunit L